MPTECLPNDTRMPTGMPTRMPTEWYQNDIRMLTECLRELDYQASVSALLKQWAAVNSWVGVIQAAPQNEVIAPVSAILA